MIELMVVISILAVLVALAAPSFNGLIERWRVRQTVDELQSAIYFARSEAIKRGGNVVLEKNPDSGSCTASGGNDSWDCGWRIRVDSNSNGQIDDDDEITQRYYASGKVYVTQTSSTIVAFDRWGTNAGTYIGFTIVPKNKNLSDPSSRGLCMSSAGRVRVILAVDLPCT